MTDTTTPKDLAKKIEWVGVTSLSSSELVRVQGCLEEVSRHLPKLLAMATWSFFGSSMPEGIETRSAEESLRSYQEREEAKALIHDLMGHWQEKRS